MCVGNRTARDYAIRGRSGLIRVAMHSQTMGVLHLLLVLVDTNAPTLALRTNQISLSRMGGRACVRQGRLGARRWPPATSDSHETPRAYRPSCFSKRKKQLHWRPCAEPRPDSLSLNILIPGQGATRNPHEYCGSPFFCPDLGSAARRLGPFCLFSCPPSHGTATIRLGCLVSGWPGRRSMMGYSPLWRL